MWGRERGGGESRLGRLRERRWDGDLVPAGFHCVAGDGDAAEGIVVEAEDLDDGGGVWGGVLVYALSNPYVAINLVRNRRGAEVEPGEFNGMYSVGDGGVMNARGCWRRGRRREWLFWGLAWWR